jgi:hypothetical protein
MSPWFGRYFSAYIGSRVRCSLVQTQKAGSTSRFPRGAVTIGYSQSVQQILLQMRGNPIRSDGFCLNCTSARPVSLSVASAQEQGS